MGPFLTLRQPKSSWRGGKVWDKNSLTLTVQISVLTLPDGTQCENFILMRLEGPSTFNLTTQRHTHRYQWHQLHNAVSFLWVTNSKRTCSAASSQLKRSHTKWLSILRPQVESLYSEFICFVLSISSLAPSRDFSGLFMICLLFQSENVSLLLYSYRFPTFKSHT